MDVLFADVDLLSELGDALSFAFGMFWEILWALILGFAISAAVQAVVSKAEMRRLLPDDSPRSLGTACGLGAATSSCGGGELEHHRRGEVAAAPRKTERAIATAA